MTDTAAHPSTSLVSELVRFSRPFTLLPPLVGYITAGFIAFEARPPVDTPFAAVLAKVLIGAFSAACLNAASNALNQIYDLDIDRLNKPDRPLPSGRLSMRTAWIFTIVCYVLTLALSLLVNFEFFVIVVVTTFLTYAYSGPPFRTKRLGMLANLTIAIPRGCLLKVAGWSAVATVLDWEPWWIGSIFGLYVLGAATTKDYSDMEGDRAGGCRTLPILYGVEKSAWIISPFFVLPFLLLSWLAYDGHLTGNRPFLIGLGLFLASWGVYICYLILRKPESLAVDENHVSWKHMYLLMMAAQVGVAVGYGVG
ncbi:MAG: UbiA family prenyltransferase [Candidatus Omnitrophica bacterium]|nr:UbiA family prenyltransferase [Candidatus Omnitrophota bacterium]